MAIVGYDGFDNYGVAADVTSRVGNLTWTGAMSLVAGPNGLGQAIQTTIGAPGITAAFANQTTVIFGARMKIITGIGGAIEISIQNTFGGATTNLGFFILNPTAGTISYTTGNPGGGPATVVWDSGGAVFTPGVWQFYEFYVQISNTTGLLKVAVDGAVLVSGSFQTTQYALTYSNSINIEQLSLTTAQIDDFYLCNTTVSPGPYPANDFMGDLRVITLYPISNDAVQWTPLAGTNWQEVSEVHFDGDVTYNSTITPGQEDTFNMGLLPTTIDAIVAVQIKGGYRKDGGGNHHIKQALKSGATEVYGATWALNTVYSFFADIWIADPNTSSTWTASAVNVIKAGYNLVD